MTNNCISLQSVGSFASRQLIWLVSVNGESKAALRPSTKPLCFHLKKNEHLLVQLRLEETKNILISQIFPYKPFFRDNSKSNNNGRG